ncbi:MAG TPA: recombinase family protein [Dehalococcoidia bacterium]|nr:recombinase family protein [Dehalococcoidia bacterium]
MAYKLDRLARNLRLLLEVEQKLASCHVSLTSVKESVDTSTGTGKMVFQMFGMIAEWERDNIIERTRSGRIQRYRDGCWAGGKPPYGYAYNKATRKLVVDETEARVVRRIYSEYGRGKALSGISEGLNRDKIPGRSKNCKGWRSTAVRQVLLNPTYEGTQIVNRHTHISDINRIDLSKAIRISVPAIVTKEIWLAAQERLKNNKRSRPKCQDEFLLQGMITCGICGHAYRAERIHGKRYYSCRGRMKYHHLDGSPRCKSPSFRAEWLESEIWQRVDEIINDPNTLSVVIRDTIENLRAREADLNARLKPIEERLAEIAQQKARLADDWVIRNMNSDKFRELKDSLDREEIRIRGLKASIDPAQIDELENTRGMLRFWERQVRAMDWNTENEDGTMTRVVGGPHQVALKVVGLEDRRLGTTTGFPASKREMLDRLNVRLFVFNHGMEVNALFPIEPIGSLSCSPPSWTGRSLPRKGE